MDPDGRRSARHIALASVKVLHTLAWFSIESCMTYLVYAGFAKRSDRRAVLAAAVVGGESVIFAANGFRCPLTDVAESLGADDSSVTDIFLPRGFAHSLPAIHVPLILLAVYLHGRNLRRNRSANANVAILTIEPPVHVMRPRSPRRSPPLRRAAARTAG